MRNSVSVVTKSNCCGCSACVNVCPHSCIFMVRDDELFAYPQVDTARCVGCGLCLDVCPSIGSDLDQYSSFLLFAAVNNSNEKRKTCSSGGVFIELATYVIEHSGVVYGAAFTSEWTVSHIRVKDAESLYKLSKSKYLQSNLGNVYKETLADLKSGIMVLFSGTPCQILGLKKYLGKRRFSNLLCVDVACHGVPSLRAWYSYLKSLGIISKDQVTNIDFRDKTYPWHNYTLTIQTKDGKSISESCDKNPFMLGFIYNLYNRPSCHNCPAKQMTSGSDIMLADFWGIEKLLPEMDDDCGTSLVIIKTAVGRNTFDAISHHFRIKSVGEEVLSSRPSTFAYSLPAHYLRDYFIANMDKKPFGKLVKQTLRHNAPFRERICRCIKYTLSKIKW